MWDPRVFMKYIAFHRTHYFGVMGRWSGLSEIIIGQIYQILFLPDMRFGYCLAILTLLDSYMKELALLLIPMRRDNLMTSSLGLDFLFSKLVLESLHGLTKEARK